MMSLKNILMMISFYKKQKAPVVNNSSKKEKGKIGLITKKLKMFMERCLFGPSTWP